jgi:hypothetical protein
MNNKNEMSYEELRDLLVDNEVPDQRGRSRSALSV